MKSIKCLVIFGRVTWLGKERLLQDGLFRVLEQIGENAFKLNLLPYLGRCSSINPNF